MDRKQVMRPKNNHSHNMYAANDSAHSTNSRSREFRNKHPYQSGPWTVQGQREDSCGYHHQPKMGAKTGVPARYYEQDPHSWESEGISTFVLKIDPPSPKKKNKKKKNRAGMILDNEGSKWHPSHARTGVPAGYYEQDDIDCRDMGFIRFKTTVDPQPELVQNQAPQPVVTQPQDNIEKTNHMTEDSSLSHQTPVRCSWDQIVHGQVHKQPQLKKNKKKKNRAGMILDNEASKWHPSHARTGVPAGYYEQDDIDCRDMGFIRFKTTVDPQPEAPQPEAPHPEGPQVETPQPEAPQLEAPQPEAPQPEDTQLECPQPEALQLEAPQPEVPQPEAPQPEAPQLEAPQLEAPQLEAPQPEAPQTEAPQPEVPQPEAPQPEVPQLEAPQPEVPQPEAPQPEAPQLEDSPPAQQDNGQATSDLAEELKKAKNDLLQKQKEWDKDRLELLFSRMDERAKHQTALDKANDTIKNLMKQLDETTSLQAKLKEETSSMETDLIQAWTDQLEMKNKWEREKSDLLAAHKNEITELQEQLAKAKKDSQWDDKRARFLEDLVTENITLKADLNQAKEVLNYQAKQWEEEKSNFLAESCRFKDDLKQAQVHLERERQQRTERHLTLQKQKETIREMAEELKKISSMEATLSQAWTDQQEMKTKWEEDKSELLAEHKKETSKLQEELAKAKQDLVSQKSRWKEEKTEDSSNMKVTLKRAEQELEKPLSVWSSPASTPAAESSDRQMERLSNVEGQPAGARGKKTNIFKKWFRVFS